MRVVAIGLVSVLCVAGLAEAQTGDDAAGRRVIQQFDEARSKADWKTASNLYLEDGTNLTSSGEWRRGRADIEKRGAATTAGVYKGGRFTTKVDSVRMLGTNTAIADGTFEISNIPGGKNRQGHSTYVLAKSGDTWRIVASRSMVPVTAGPGGTQ